MCEVAMLSTVHTLRHVEVKQGDIQVSFKHLS